MRINGIKQSIFVGDFALGGDGASVFIRARGGFYFEIGKRSDAWMCLNDVSAYQNVKGTFI
jgi:hypothetical protein